MDRFQRQRTLLGDAGQARVAAARVLVVGLGGLGSPVARLLAGAGVGTLGLCDFDTADATNLQRQGLYTAQDVGEPKVERAIGHLREVDPGLMYVPHVIRMDPDAARQMVPHYDVVVGCTDDAAAAYAMNDACQRLGKTFVHAACSSWEGEVTTVVPGGPCLRCLRPRMAQGPTCAQEGVLGPVPATLGSIQAGEALKAILGEPVLSGRLLLWDARGGLFDLIPFGARPGCTHVSEDGPACPLPGTAPETDEVAVRDVAANLAAYHLVDVREDYEFEEVRIPGAHLVPLGQLAQRLAELPADRPLVCICAVGGRSARAAEFLNARGYRAYNLVGGMRAWLAQRLPVER